MKKQGIIIAAGVLSLFVAGGLLLRQSPDSGVSMPGPGETTSLWWQEGFPGVVTDAPWHQCLETGEYAFVFDAEKVAFPTLGTRDDERALSELPPADLELLLTIDGKSYRHRRGGEWSRFTGPRLVNSGRFFQRFDVTDLVFEAEDQTRLNVDARFEVAAWHDRLTLTMEARPGHSPLKTGLEAFGKAGGGFGLDGTNRFEIEADAVGKLPAFTLSFHAFIPPDFKASQHGPWLLCKSANEH